MEKFGVGLLAVFLFGWIGSWFGDPGGLIGVIFGVMVGFSHNPEEAKKLKGQKMHLPNRVPESANITNPKSECYCGSGKRYENCHRLKAERIDSFNNSSFSRTKAKDDGLYAEVVTELMAACIVADVNIEESEIDLATLFIESDDAILDKKGALEKLKINIDEFHKERMKSKAVFKLKMTLVMHKVKEISSDLQKERVLVILDGMLDAINDGNRQEPEEFVEKVKQILSVSSAPVSKQDVAERYILDSGNTEAISFLREMKKNPSTYKEKFKQASKGNSIMRTALGVFTGVIAANLVTSAIHQHQLNEALSNFNAEIESMGGIDNLQIDQESNIHSGSLYTAEEEMPYEYENTDKLQVVESEDIEVDEDIDIDGGDDFEFDLFS